MVKFGVSQQYYPQIKKKVIFKRIINLFGGIDTSSSHLHFIKIIGCGSFSRILDAGCGKGKFSFWLAKNFPHVKIFAIDISEENILLCNKIKLEMKIKNIIFKKEDLRKIKIKKKFDLVFTNHVLEHIRENRKVLRTLLNAIVKGGYVYIQIPNEKERRYSFGKRFLANKSKWDQSEHIGQTFDLGTLSNYINSFGFKTIITKYTEGFFGELRFELNEMALSYFNNKKLFYFMFPLLKILGYLDFLKNNNHGNGLLYFGKKIH